jgi:hypothetical protein
VLFFVLAVYTKQTSFAAVLSLITSRADGFRMIAAAVDLIPRSTGARRSSLRRAAAPLRGSKCAHAVPNYTRRGPPAEILFKQPEPPLHLNLPLLFLRFGAALHARQHLYDATYFGI